MALKPVYFNYVCGRSRTLYVTTEKLYTRGGVRWETWSNKTWKSVRAHRLPDEQGCTCHTLRGRLSTAEVGIETESSPGSSSLRLPSATGNELSTESPTDRAESKLRSMMAFIAVIDSPVSAPRSGKLTATSFRLALAAAATDSSHT